MNKDVEIILVTWDGYANNERNNKIRGEVIATLIMKGYRRKDLGTLITPENGRCPVSQVEFIEGYATKKSNSVLMVFTTSPFIIEALSSKYGISKVYKMGERLVESNLGEVFTSFSQVFTKLFQGVQ